MRVKSIFLSLSLVSLLVGCKRAPTDSPKPVAKAKAATSGKPAVARIVFVDQEKACACTRKRIDASWKALTDVVGFPPVPEVERIHMDSQPKKAAPYKKQRPIMVPPAIYFFDKQNKLVKVLQGEVKSEQVRTTLN